MASSHQTEPSSSRTEHTYPIDIDRAINLLRNNIDAMRRLESGKIEFDDPKVDTTQKTIRETIRDIFGADSPEYNDHSQHKIWHGSQIYLEARDKRQQKFSAGIPHTVNMLEGLISRLEDRRRNLKAEAPAPAPIKEQKIRKLEAPVKQHISEVSRAELPRRTVTGRICVVHGHNDALKNAVCDYLEKLGLEPIVLHKQQNNTRDIVEKIDSLPEVDYAVVLLTADDFFQPGKSSRNSKPYQMRNVLFELGYYVGRLGQSRVCALYKGHDKPPRDYDGISCLTISENQVWRRLLGLELQAAGFEINSEIGE